MEIRTLHELFVHELQGVYHMEQRLVGMLDEMSVNATNDRISSGFADHRDETQRHVDRVEEVFAAMDLQPEARACPIVEALDQERRTVEESVQDEGLLNLFYLGAGIKTERIELTSYDSLILMANRLDFTDEVTAPLKANRDSEDETLSKLKTLNTASEMKSLWERLVH